MELRRKYPSDITREQFDLIKYQLESSSKTTHPMDYDLYDIFCAVLYILKEGCLWRSLPGDYPKWQIVYYHFRKRKKKMADGRSIFDNV